uniref:Uncharacterized protein n=1 Tax=Romanomermis culicivorax TaxID=13658 RepID=A0A915KKZ6_ROMCU
MTDFQLFQLAFDQRFDTFQKSNVVLGDESDGRTGTAGAGSPTDPVDRFANYLKIDSPKKQCLPFCRCTKFMTSLTATGLPRARKRSHGKMYKLGYSPVT